MLDILGQMLLAGGQGEVSRLSRPAYCEMFRSIPASTQPDISQQPPHSHHHQLPQPKVSGHRCSLGDKAVQGWGPLLILVDPPGWTICSCQLFKNLSLPHQWWGLEYWLLFLAPSCISHSGWFVFSFQVTQQLQLYLRRPSSWWLFKDYTLFFLIR